MSHKDTKPFSILQVFMTDTYIDYYISHINTTPITLTKVKNFRAKINPLTLIVHQS